ncbi:hypothetical protein FKW77_003927 [Venturia effusa]|uniref:Uncharacterized protein n=1 Tax=Venturia effusa TaxID=50376 RepID=A0A517LQ33_9PEZI|nr:hypothetical protein FKW77_003927 [Venturia effusa]
MEPARNSSRSQSPGWTEVVLRRGKQQRKMAHQNLFVTNRHPERKKKSFVTPRTYTPPGFLISHNRDFAQDFCTMVSIGGNELNKFNTGHDRIMAQAIPVLRQHNVSTYHRFLANMRMAPTTSAAASSNDGIKLYTFLERGAVGRTVPLRLSGKTAKGSVSVQVRLGGVWIKLAAWLSKLPTHFVDRLEDRGYAKQFKWWSKNGKTFDIMKLPLELREHLYLHFLGPDIYPNFPFQSTMCPLKHPSYSFAYIGKQEFDLAVRGYTSHPDANRYCSGPNHSVLQLNRTLRIEAIRVGWEHTRICFSSVYHISKFVHAQAQTPFRSGRQIRLEFADINNFADFFGLRDECYPHSIPARGRTRQPTEHGPVLCNIFPQLEDLQIRFPSTARSQYHSLGDRSFCQSNLIDWVMNYAFKHIKHIKKVTLTGYVKTAQKQAWEDALQNHYIRGEDPPGLDENAVAAQARATYPPRCTCKFSCVLPRQEMGCQCRISNFAMMNPDSRKDGDCRCFWFDKDDLGWDGYVDWCEKTKGNFHPDAEGPFYFEAEAVRSQRYQETHPELESCFGFGGNGGGDGDGDGDGWSQGSEW